MSCRNDKEERESIMHTNIMGYCNTTVEILLYHIRFFT
jgi:hypothetical protein